MTVEISVALHGFDITVVNGFINKLLPVDQHLNIAFTIKPIILNYKHHQFNDNLTHLFD